MTWQVILLSFCVVNVGKVLLMKSSRGCITTGKKIKYKQKTGLYNVQHHKSHLLNPAREHGYSCYLCKYTTSCKAYLVNHSLVCGCVCNAQPKEMHSLSWITNRWKKHMDIHANIECPKCKKIFDAKRNMKRHVKNVHKAHNDTSRIKWVQCGRQF